MAALGLFVCALGTPRLPGGPLLERLMSALKLGTLLLGIGAVRHGLAKPERQAPWTAAGLVSLAFFFIIVLAVWCFRT